ncbi:MAG TPA: hypothetical protein VIV06_10000, partial [Candidatus Limnocylindrales bacterium]
AGLALARRLGQRFWVFSFLTGIGYGAFRLGDWDKAEAELQAGLAEEPDPVDRIPLLSNLINVRACRGVAVAEEIAELDRLVGDSTDPMNALMLHDAHAYAALAAGDLEAAARGWRRVGSLSAAQVPSARLSAAHCAAWSGSLAEVEADLGALDESGIRGPLVAVQRTAIIAMIAALEGRSADAIRLFRETGAGWRAMGFAFDDALSALDLVVLLPADEPAVRTAAASARTILERLGARPFLDRLDAASAGQPARPAETAGRVPS